MRVATYSMARRIAIANAAHANQEWIVFNDTSGMWNAELSTADNQNVPGREVFHPLPEWAKNAVRVQIQELVLEGVNIYRLYAEDVLDFVYDHKPKDMKDDQFQKDVAPMALHYAISHGMKEPYPTQR